MQTINDISKETLTFLAFFDTEMIKKIPSNVISKLCEEAASSTEDFFVDSSKNFKEQNISEKSKDLISLIYYNYIADEVEKIEIEKSWKLNDTNYELLQKEKYSNDSIFDEDIYNIKKCNENILPVIEKRENVFYKILNIIKKILFNRKG